MEATSPTKRNVLKPSLDWLLIFVPISIALRLMGQQYQTALFITSCLAIVPLAGWMGRATEHLAEKMGQGIGGLLNATFGNAAELIIALMALHKGLYGVVKASITGSIIGNVLLVLGLSFFTGGLHFKQQKFNRTAARSAATTLILAAIALMVPTVFHLTADDVSVAAGGWTPAKEQQLSLAIAVVLILTYAATLYFSLRTHKGLFTGAEDTSDEIEEAHGEHWRTRKAVVVLFIATLFVALISEFLVGAVEGARTQLGMTEVFVGVIVVAIIGNAAEHSSAVLMALKNKMDLSLGIAIGSSAQIALFVAPVLVFASYIFAPMTGHPPLDLEFTIPEVVAVVVAIGLAGQVSGDGESNWLEGVQLLSVYLVLGILFFFLPDAHHAASAAH